MGTLKKLAGDTVIYGASSILGRLLNYLLVPYYTHVFASGEYGVVTEMYAYAAFFNVLYTYGLETAYFRFATMNKDGEPAVFNYATTAILFTSIVLSGILILLATPIVNYLHYPGKENFIIWFALIFAIDAVMAIPFAKLRLEGKSKQFALAKLGNIGLNIGFNLFFLSVCPAVLRGHAWASLKPFIESFYNPSLGVDYVFLSNLLANAALVFFLWNVLRKLTITFDWLKLKPLLIYAYPILFAGLAWVTNEMLSRLALRFWLPDNFYAGKTSAEALGIFGAVYKFSVFMTLAVQAFRYAAEPFFFSKAAEKNSKALFSKVSHGFILFGCIILLAVSTNLDVLEHILRRPEYREGMHVVPILLLANLFLGIYYNVSIWYKLTDKTYYSTWIAIGGAILTIVLNYFLIPVAGYEGSSWVTLIVYFLMAVVCYAIGQRYYPIPYPVIKDLTYMAVTILLIYMVNGIEFSNLWAALSVKLAIVLAFSGMIYVVEFKKFKAKAS
ncbi:MAG: polysaccharide biosynthesis C-terminal domain-containing protein [Cyclobacteriaceae bacterium]|nr:polysaccharide biosynthesis C-terminal domain-containing protein [Cyclobacteriaceae bacterium]UYN86450.1 MAG: polysaccharide biosynthesis C-terminal domain-containing protein [Cyclobacteriaceae bacterium]